MSLSRSSGHIRDKVFAVILSFLLAGPFLLYCAQELLVLDLPSWLTSKDAIHMAGGVAKEDVESNLSWAGFRDRKLQKALEGRVANHLPMKANALVADSAAERLLIETGNKLIGYDAEPTKLSSHYVYIGEADAVSYVPEPLSSWMRNGVKRFMTGASSFAKNHPDTDILVYVVGGYQNPAVSPLDEIYPDRSFEDILSAFEASAEGDPANLQVLGSEYDSIDAYYRDFFRTDHHWNARGAYKAYEQMAEALALDVVDAGEEVRFDDYAFRGATARAAIYPLDEVPFDLDIDFDFDELCVIDDQGNHIRDVDHEDYWASVEPGLIYTFYDGYYDNLGSNTIIGGSGEGNICLISDSYGAGVQRTLAASAASLRRYTDLHPSFKGENSLEDRLASVSGDTIIFVGSPADYAKLGNAHSDYFQ